MNKGLIIGAIVIIALLAVGGWWWMMYGANANVADINSNQNTNTGSTAKGTVYFNFKDAALNMGTVSAVNMTVDKVYVHSATEGWVTVASNPQTFSLLAIKESGKAALMAKVDLPAGTYDQVWFHVTALSVTETGKTAKPATLPATDFKMQGVVKVLANTISTATFDILADQSIYKTDKGEFIFMPVVQFESRSKATVNLDSNNMVDITAGNVDASTSSGMDINGEVKANFKVDLTQKLEIKEGVISLKAVI